jgi:SAC3 family protein LENG8/THP3
MVSAWTTTTQQQQVVTSAAPAAPYTAYAPSLYPDHFLPPLHQASLLKHSNTGPAYVPVAVRPGFGSHVATSYPVAPHVHSSSTPSDDMTAQGLRSEAKKSEQPSQGKVVWPESVRNYVSRSFHPDNDEPTVPRHELEAKLKEVIRAATDNGTLYSIDWDSMPFPQALVKAERAAAAGNALFNPKKRKSTEYANSGHAQNNWPTTTNPGSSLQDRITKPEKFVALDESPKPSKFQKEANKRKRRFENEYKAFHGSSSSSASPPPSSGPITGTCEVLEKKYLRLTAPPVPSMVRPERILQQTLDLLKKKWRKEGNYSYICDQFKSMRQDLTVQHIKNDFTVSVYEIHARIALEKGDIGEYNQCQTQLRSLYMLGLKGNSIEFKAYRILYFIHTANRTGLNDTLTDLTAAEKKERPIRHALDVRSALALGNYHRFFQLYLDTPNMGAYLMDMFIVRERLAAMCNICKSYV